MRKDTIGVCCLLASTAMILMIAWFFQPHPVVASPENTRIMFIEIGGGEDEDFTIPSPEQEKQILAFLSTCKETHTTRRELSGGYDAAWKCMTVMLAFPNGQVRGVLLAPSEDEEVGASSILNTSYPASGSTGFFDTICTLQNPKEIRNFLDTVLLQEDEESTT